MFQDIVGTSSVTQQQAVIVPLPPTNGLSKIPRLVDHLTIGPKHENPSPFRRDSDFRRSDSRIELMRKTSAADIQPSPEGKKPFIRQPTYTKLEDSPNTVRRKMASLDEREELDLSTGDLQYKPKNSLPNRVSSYRREKSSPEISTSAWAKKRSESQWEKSMVETADKIQHGRESRSESLDSQATYNVEPSR